jgi:poly-gamma-glutamate synthesis protein (capsule biosynthesis protein)
MRREVLLGVTAGFGVATLTLAGLIAISLNVPVAQNYGWQLVEKTKLPEIITHPGLGPECPEDDCFTITVNGDLLFHDGLWNQYRTDPSENDGHDFDFTELFSTEKIYYDQSDLAICDMETPIAPVGGPYFDYPIFNTPPEVLAAAAKAGYDACTNATNHSFDRGVEGIERTNGEMDRLGIQHAGAYLTEAESEQPMILETEAGKVAVIPGTVSTNGFVLDEPWRVDTLYPDREQDYEKMLAKAKTARQQGAEVVVAAIHSVQEYIDYADTWQIETAHWLIDSGLFDLVYSHGSHAVQPIEQYRGKFIIYGVGNSVCESADPDNDINNHGLTVRTQFALGDDGWYAADLAWLATNNERQGHYQWCPLASDHPFGFCTTETRDQALRDNIERVVYSMGAPADIVHEWLITDEVDEQLVVND